MNNVIWFLEFALKQSNPLSGIGQRGRMEGRNVLTVLELGDEYMEYMGVHSTILSTFKYV